jgi:hypothetical protein
MNREVHVRFCEKLGGRFPLLTRPIGMQPGKVPATHAASGPVVDTTRPLVNGIRASDFYKETLKTKSREAEIGTYLPLSV